jgi:23S rRNA (cytosine1962-C5)-methyltransferase
MDTKIPSALLQDLGANFTCTDKKWIVSAWKPDDCEYSPTDLGLTIHDMPLNRKSSSQPSLRLRLTAAAESIVRGGHPWVFAQSVREQNREGTTGELAIIFDRQDRFLAVGLFDAESPLRVRILHVGKPQAIDVQWWRRRAEKAFALRKSLFGADTTGFRCINGENDGWPGLVLDQYDTARVLKLYTAAWLPRLPEMGDLLHGGHRLILRLSRNIQKHALQDFSLKDGEILHGPALEGPVIFLENGLRFEADVIQGQKTGFFLDQRENRRLVEGLASGRSVLNLFSYSGGFSLYAARGGASSVCSLDISEHALASAVRNFGLNQTIPSVAHCRHETIQADVFGWLWGRPERRFDLIVLDPPSMARRETEREEALRAYGKLMSASITLLSKNGVLVAASCSAHVSADEFFAAARESAHQSGRRFEELRTTRHPDDHPATFPEGEYLKCVYFRFLG